MSEVVRTLTPALHRVAGGVRRALPPPVAAHQPTSSITAAAYLPLIAQARPIGAHRAALPATRRGFTAEERNVLVALGSSIAQSLQRAMLYEQENDLAAGPPAGDAAAPHPRRARGAEVAVRYRSGAALGRDIGGDWYDLIPLPGGRVGAVIGDVQGHDTHAAAVMGQLRIVLRAYAAEGHTPATVMARASVFLHELDTDRFATCLYAEADLTTGVVQVVRAGHIDPLIRSTRRQLPPARRSTAGCRSASPPSSGSLEYPVGTLELDPGDTLLLCTDGLVEQPGADLDDGMQALTALIAAGPQDVRDLADRLCDVAEERGGDDDVALLLLRRRGLDAPQPGGRLQQHVAPGDPEALTAGPAHDPGRGPRLGRARSAPTRSSWSPTS